MLPTWEPSPDRMIRADSTARRCPDRENAPVNIISKSVAVTFGAVLLLAVFGCSVDSPQEHSQRLQKAAGLKTFHIDTSKELWTATSDQTPYDNRERPIKAKLTPLPNGLQRVELSGVSLANYLRELDHDAHGGASGDTPWGAAGTRSPSACTTRSPRFWTRPSSGLHRRTRPCGSSWTTPSSTPSPHDDRLHLSNEGNHGEEAAHCFFARNPELAQLAVDVPTSCWTPASATPPSTARF